jgi:hypothetical protein
MRQPTRIRFLGGKTLMTGKRTRLTREKAGRCGAGGHSVGGRSLLPSHVGVVGSSSASSSWVPASSDGRDSASGEVDDDDEEQSASCTRGGEVGAGVVVLIGGSVGMTSAAELILIVSRMRCVRGTEGVGEVEDR